MNPLARTSFSWVAFYYKEEDYLEKITMFEMRPKLGTDVESLVCEKMRFFATTSVRPLYQRLFQHTMYSII